MKRKTIFWALLLGILALAAGGWYALAGGGGTVAAVYVEGELVARYDLSAIALPREERIETARGYNILRLSHGAVEVIEADCDGQDCVRQGAIRDSLLPIICLPHRLVVEIEE